MKYYCLNEQNINFLFASREIVSYLNAHLPKPLKLDCMSAYTPAHAQSRNEGSLKVEVERRL